MLNNYIQGRNKSAFQFSSQASSEVKKICEPLDRVGIRFFRYLRVFEDCSYITLMNGYNEFLANYYDVIHDLGNYWGKSIRYTESKDKPFYLVWPMDGFNRDINMSLFYNHNIWNGISLIYKHKEYIEIVSYAFDRNSSQGGNLFLNCQNFLEDFASYFKQHLGAIIGEAEQSKRAVFSNKFKIFARSKEFVEQKNTLDSIKDVSIDANILDTDRGVVRLTDKERECLEMFAQGKTAKDVAREVDISHRTVEYHMFRMKHKTGASNKSDLLELFFKNKTL